MEFYAELRLRGDEYNDGSENPKGRVLFIKEIFKLY